MQLPFPGLDTDCKPHLVCWPSQDPHSAFCFLIGIPTRPCPKSLQKHPSAIKQPELSPATNYPALPQRNRRSPDYISCCCIINVPRPAVISLILSYCADSGWCPQGFKLRQEFNLICRYRYSTSPITSGVPWEMNAPLSWGKICYFLHSCCKLLTEPHWSKNLPEPPQVYTPKTSEID